jgi:hypothetical protein
LGWRCQAGVVDSLGVFVRGGYQVGWKDTFGSFVHEGYQVPGERLREKGQKKEHFSY